MSDIIFQVENAPNINFDVNQEANEVTFEVQNEIIEMEVQGVVFGEKGPAGEGIDTFDIDLALLYQISKL